MVHCRHGRFGDTAPFLRSCQAERKALQDAIRKVDWTPWDSDRDFFGKLMGFYGGLMGFNRIYPLVKIQKTMEGSTHFVAGKINYFDWAIFNCYTNLVGGLEHEFYDFPYWECHHPN